MPSPRCLFSSWLLLCLGKAVSQTPPPPPPPFNSELDYCGGSHVGATVDCGSELLGMGWNVLDEFGTLSPSRFGGPTIYSTREMRTAGWVTDVNAFNHPTWTREPFDSRVQFFTSLNDGGGVRRRLPCCGMFELLVAFSGSNCYATVTDDAGQTEAHGADAQVTKFTYTSSSHDAAMLSIQEIGGHFCYLSYVLVKPVGASSMPPPLPPPPPEPHAPERYCADSSCGAELISQGWNVLTEFGNMARFGSSPGNPPSSSSKPDYPGSIIVLDACWHVGVNHIDNPYFGYLSPHSTSFYGNSNYYNTWSSETEPDRVAADTMSTGWISHSLPSDGVYELLVGWAGNKFCNLKVIDDTGTRTFDYVNVVDGLFGGPQYAELPSAASDFIVTLTTFDASNSKAGEVLFEETNDGLCSVGYVLIRGAGQYVAPSCAPPSPPSVPPAPPPFVPPPQIPCIDPFPDTEPDSLLLIQGVVPGIRFVNDCGKVCEIKMVGDGTLQSSCAVTIVTPQSQSPENLVTKAEMDAELEKLRALIQSS